MDIDEMINRLRRKAKKYDMKHNRVGRANWGEGAYYAGEKVFMDRVSLTLESQAAELKAQQARIEELEKSEKFRAICAAQLKSAEMGDGFLEGLNKEDFMEAFDNTIEHARASARQVLKEKADE